MLLNSALLNSAVVNGASGRVLLNSSISCGSSTNCNISIAKPISTNAVSASSLVGTIIYLRQLESLAVISPEFASLLKLSKYLSGGASAVCISSSLFQKINFSAAEDFSFQTQIIGRDLYMTVEPYQLSFEVELIDLSLH